MIHYETKPVYGACVNDHNLGYLNRYLGEIRQIDEFPEEAYPQALDNLNCSSCEFDEKDHYIPSEGFGNLKISGRFLLLACSPLARMIISSRA